MHLCSISIGVSLSAVGPWRPSIRKSVMSSRIRVQGTSYSRYRRCSFYLFLSKHFPQVLKSCQSASSSPNDSMMHQKYIIGTSPWMYETKDRLGLIVTGLVCMRAWGWLVLCAGEWHSMCGWVAFYVWICMRDCMCLSEWALVLLPQWVYSIGLDACVDSAIVCKHLMMRIYRKHFLQCIGGAKNDLFQSYLELFLFF